MTTLRKAIVVTSISPPNEVLRAIAKEALDRGFHFIVIGDEKSPSRFELDGCDFYSVERQRSLPFKTAELAPLRHYARKNIGYLVAANGGAQIILETDDDNLPYDEFWKPRARVVQARASDNHSWLNVYRYFTDTQVWPRGFPLELIQDAIPDFSSFPLETVDCPIQQGLADDNPDVDAIYRLTRELPIRFSKDREIAVGVNSWCPFNSQNTAWWESAFPLLYLPAFCSFRMTDIWRSFVAQRIAWTQGWSVLFHGSTVTQARNEHNLMKDFEDEIPGYLNNVSICRSLETLLLDGGRIEDYLKTAYQMLVTTGVIPEQELDLLEAWLADWNSISRARTG